MAEVTVGHYPEWTVKSAMEVFRRHFAGKYDVYEFPSSWLMGQLGRRRDFIVKKSGWTAVGVRLKQEPNATSFVFTPYVPSVTCQFLWFLGGLLPGYVLLRPGWQALEDEVRSFLAGTVREDRLWKVGEKKDMPQSVAEDRKWRRMAEDRKALYKLRKEDPEAAERIIKEIDSGKASMADLGTLVAGARHDALSVERAEERLRAEDSLPPAQALPKDEDASDTAPESGVLVCPNCGHEEPSDRTSCPHCGMPLEP